MTAEDRVGLIPAAGRGSRLGALPLSKEVFPVIWEPDLSGVPRPVAAAETLIRKFRFAGADRAFVVLREGKWDIPAYLGDGERQGLTLGYLMMRWPFGQPFTLDAAHPFLGEATVLFGFPDILFGPEDAYVRLLERLETSQAEVVLGLFPARRPEKMDMVEGDGSGRVTGIVIKPTATDLRYTWIIAVWTGAFTRFLHEFVERRLDRNLEGSVPADGAGPRHPDGRELYLGDVFTAAIAEGLVVDSLTFEDASYIDIGTPAELLEAVRKGVESDPPDSRPVPSPERGAS